MSKPSKILIIALLFIGGFALTSRASANTCVYQTTGNWTTAGTWTGCGGVAPTAADNVLVGTGVGATTTGTLTIDAGAVARSADFTSFAGTVVQGSTGTLTLGDATAGAGNVALNMPAGFTYAPNAASTITFISTSATQQTITINSGYAAGNLTFNSASNGNYAITANLTTTATSLVTLTKGTLHTDGTSDVAGLTHSWAQFNSNVTTARVLNLGNSAITITRSSVNAWNINDTTNLTLTAGNSSITISGTAAATLWGGTGGSAKTYYDVAYTGGGVMVFNGALGNTFHNLTVVGTAVKNDNISFNGDFTVTGTLKLWGNNSAGASVNRLLVFSSVLGTQHTITNTGATMDWQNVDFKDMALGTLYDASAITGNSGDCGGNSGITFTAASTQTSTGTASFTWSTHGWTTRVPLPQDDVVVNNAFISGRTVTMDMPRLGHTLDFSGATWSGTAPVFSPVVNVTLFGSRLFPSGLATQAGNYTFEGRSGTLANGTSSSMPANGWLITSAGNTVSGTHTLQAFGGTYQQQDAFNGTGAFVLTNGTWDANNFNFTAGGFLSNGALTRAILMGTGTWTMTSTGANTWNVVSTLSVTPSSSTIVISNTTATSKTFAGGGLTYNNVTFSGDNITITGSNTFNGTFAVNNAGLANGLLLTANTTTTVAQFTTNATTTSALAIASSTGAAARLVKTGGDRVCTNFMKLTNLAAAPSSIWFAGGNSTDNGGNTGWVFNSCPSGNFWTNGMGFTKVNGSGFVSIKGT